MAHTHDHADNVRHTRGGSLPFAFALTCAMLIAEAIGGVWSGSLALLADAGHMLVDAASLLLAWMAAYFASRPADEQRSFGYARLEVLAGFVNALIQVLLVAWIGYEAIGRLLAPHEIHILSGVMLAVASAGLLVNLIVLRALRGHDADDINAAGVNLHVLGDLLGSIATVVAALLVRYLHWQWADPALSLLVSLLILRGAWVLLRRSSHILLEGVPEGLRTKEIQLALLDADTDIVEIHHLHVWQIASGLRMATLHARLCEGADPQSGLLTIKRVLSDRFGIGHATVQIEAEQCADRAAGCGQPHAHDHR